MSGYKAEVIITDLNTIKDSLKTKAINRVTIDFEAFENSGYPLHEKLYLVRETNEGKIVFLTDFTIEGDEHFGGDLNNNIYSFNIFRRKFWF